MPEISTLGEPIADASEEFLPASVLPNDSAVAGAKIKDALEALLAAIGAISYPVTSVYGRLGDVVSAVGDYAASQVTNDSSVAGARVSNALNTLGAAIAAITYPVTSVYGRLGDVVSAVGDYAASQVTNDSSVAGARVSNALNTLSAAIAAIPPAPVSTVFGRIGAVVSAVGDYAASQVTNDSSVSGARVSNALNTLSAAIAAIPPAPVSTVFGRIGAVVSAVGDYAASQVTNDSSVSGARVSNALNTLLAAIPSVPVSSVFGRIGAVVSAANDYAASQVSNDSSVSGANVKLALNALLAAIPSVPVQLVFGRTGSITAQSGDYTATQVGLGNVTNDAQLKRADNDWSGYSTQTGSPASGDKFLIERASDNGKRVMLAASLGSTYSSRDAIWDRPTTGSADDEEFDTDVLASGAWSISLTASMGTPMTRDGAFDPSAAPASGHYRSSVIGGVLYLLLRQNEEIFMWKTVAGALSSHVFWFAGMSFINEMGTANATDPRMSLQYTKNNAGVPSFSDRAFIRTLSSNESYQVFSQTGGATVTNLSTNTFTLAPLEGLALRLNHGSAAAGNFGGFGFRRNGTILAVQNGNAQQFNSATDKVGFNLLGNVAQSPGGVNNTIFALHFLRRVPVTGWIAQP